jgi:LysM repeat protein
MASFEEQKSKYQSVIQTIQAEGIHLANLHQQDGKLFMKGSAPSVEAANKVWDEIKRINPRLDDIMADFPVDPSLATKPAPSAASTPSTPSTPPTPSAKKTPQFQLYIVKPGDTLSKISQQFYGNSKEYMRIFNANKDKLKDPDHVNVGQELKIPAA